MAFSVAVAQRGLGSPYDTLLVAAAGQTGVPLALLKGIVSQESAWNAAAVNAADPSYGLMQINTRAHPDVTPAQALDPSFAIPYGAAYLASLIARDGLPAAISSYNAGRPITGNAAYVSAVLAYQAWFEANDPLSTPWGDTVSALAVPPVAFADADPIPQTDSYGNLVGWYVGNADGTTTTWDANGENPTVTALSAAGGLSVTTGVLLGAAALLLLGGLGASR